MTPRCSPICCGWVGCRRRGSRPEVREQREMVRYRAKLSRLRAGLKAQVHQTLGKEGVIPQLDSIWLAWRPAVA